MKYLWVGKNNKDIIHTDFYLNNKPLTYNRLKDHFSQILLNLPFLSGKNFVRSSIAAWKSGNHQ